MHLEPFEGNRVDGEFVIAEWSQTAEEVGLWIAPLHRHDVCDEAWYVLEGKLGFLVDGVESIVGEGGLMFVRRGSVHSFWNADNAKVRYLLVMTKQTASLIDAIHTADDRSVPGLQALFTDHGAEFIGWDQPQ